MKSFLDLLVQVIISLVIVTSAKSYFVSVKSLTRNFHSHASLTEPTISNPNHVAFIVDGNGRWAETKNLSRTEGHRMGATISPDIVKKTFEYVDYVTLYLFSTENWSRPKHEVENIMFLLETYLLEFSSYLKQNKINIVTIGQLHRLPSSLLKILEEVGYKPTDNCTSNKSIKTLILAISYGGRDDIVSSCKLIVKKALKGELTVDEIDTNLFSKFTQTGQQQIPDPEMIVRSSGEKRLSNFLLWQSAYSEFFSISKFCKFSFFLNSLYMKSKFMLLLNEGPDVTPEDVVCTIDEFKTRKRRFGKVL